MIIEGESFCDRCGELKDLTVLDVTYKKSASYFVCEDCAFALWKWLKPQVPKE
jgi:hypothetical protein